MTAQARFEQNTNPTWYLVQCQPRDGFRADEHLRNQNFQTFHPTHQVKRRRNGRYRWETESLFPHYLFVRLYPEQSFAAVNSTRGVTRVVGFNKTPMPVPSAIITGLMRQMRAINGEEWGDSIYKPGDTVTITDGCFKDIQAVVKATKGEERVILLMNLINRPQELTLPAKALQPC